MWSGDGRELFYQRGRAVVVARVETTPDFRVVSRERLFEGPYFSWPYHASYDVHPDGQRFVMIKHFEEGVVRLVVVVNWIEELKRLMPEG